MVVKTRPKHSLQRPGFEINLARTVIVRECVSVAANRYPACPRQIAVSLVNLDFINCQIQPRPHRTRKRHYDRGYIRRVVIGLGNNFRNEVVDLDIRPQMSRHFIHPLYMIKDIIIYRGLLQDGKRSLTLYDPVY